MKVDIKIDLRSYSKEKNREETSNECESYNVAISVGNYIYINNGGGAGKYEPAGMGCIERAGAGLTVCSKY